MSELERLIKSGKETRVLDYKGSCTWDEGDKKACCELVKDVLAMANSGGGVIVIGVAERQGVFQFDGLSELQLTSYDTTRFNRFLGNYSDPPINCTIAKVPVDGRQYVVLEVPAFTDTPHVCQKEFPGVLSRSFLYVRTANNESAPVTSSADFRRIVETAVRNQQDKLLASFRGILTGSQVADQTVQALSHFETELEQLRPIAQAATSYSDEYGDKSYRGFREAWAFPSAFDPKRLELATLRRIAQRATVDYVGWPFLFIQGQGQDKPMATDGGLSWTGRHQDFLDQDRADYWHIGSSGLFLQRVLMWEESYAKKHKSPPILDVSATAQYAAEALKCVTLLYDDVLPPEEPLTVGIRIYGTKGRVLANIHPQAMPLWQRYECKPDAVTYQETRTLADWRAGITEHAVEVCRYVFERFNWENPSLNLCRATIEKLWARKLF